jgi:putative oxidoreductase
LSAGGAALAFTLHANDPREAETVTNDHPLAWLRPYLLALLRVMTALLFLEHATQKLFDFPSSRFQVPLLSLMGAAGVIELVGSVLLIVGLFTRPVAFILSGEMAFAYFMGHASSSFFPIQNFGESAILFCFIYLYMVAAGPGAFSLDGWRAGARGLPRSPVPAKAGTR